MYAPLVPCVWFALLQLHGFGFLSTGIGTSDQIYGATLPAREKASWVTGNNFLNSSFIALATNSISYCGYEGKVESGCVVRNVRNDIRDLGLHVTYMCE